MSVIYDALKKAEKAITNSQGKTDKKESPSRFRVRLYLVYALVICSGLFIGNSVFVFLHRTKTTSEQPKPLSGILNKDKPVTARTSGMDLPQPIPPEQQIPATKTPPNVSTEMIKGNEGIWVLNGVFFSEDEGYALINNKIVKVGDTVSGATVKGIYLDEVELQTQEGPVKLSTSAR